MPINDRLDKESVVYIHHGILHSLRSTMTRVATDCTRPADRRERERMAFISAEYWDLSASLQTQGNAQEEFDARSMQMSIHVRSGNPRGGRQNLETAIHATVSYMAMGSSRYSRRLWLRRRIL